MHNKCGTVDGMKWLTIYVINQSYARINGWI